MVPKVADVHYISLADQLLAFAAMAFRGQSRYLPKRRSSLSKDPCPSDLAPGERRGIAECGGKSLRA